MKSNFIAQLLCFVVMISAGICNAQYDSKRYRRVALVIGNSDYKQAPLDNPANDAKSISRTLEDVGFEVTTKFDRDKFEIEADLDEITKGLRRGDAVFFFYAGHGIQIRNTNYMIPVDAVITREYHVEQRCVDLGYALQAMEYSDASLKVVMLDACRDNPFRSFTRSRAKGLASVEAPEGTIVAFSTAPGLAALDGNGQNSPFTKHLVKTLQSNPKQGLEIREVFNTVARAVKLETGQRAFVNSDASMEKFMLKRPQTTREPSHKETLQAVVNAVKRMPDTDICTFQDVIPEYKALISALLSSQKLQAHGVYICFPSEETWNNDPVLRRNIIRVLANNGILKFQAADPRQQIANLPDPKFDKVRLAANDYVHSLKADFCALRDLVRGYRELIDQLVNDEKFEVFPGITICFPSQATWDAKPFFRKQLISLLRQEFVIDF